MADTHTQITAEPGVPLITITSEFDAPRDLVFRAYTEPDLLMQWLGPRRFTGVVERQELRDGGRWRFVHSDDQGNAYGFHGVFHGEQSPDLMVRTFEFEGAPGHVSLEMLTIVERDGRSLVRSVAAYFSVEDRDAMLQGGMEDGVRDGNERLAELLERLKAARKGRAA